VYAEADLRSNLLEASPVNARGLPPSLIEQGFFAAGNANSSYGLLPGTGLTDLTVMFAQPFNIGSKPQ
jgi:hypothetical protein